MIVCPRCQFSNDIELEPGDAFRCEKCNKKIRAYRRGESPPSKNASATGTAVAFKQVPPSTAIAAPVFRLVRSGSGSSAMGGTTGRAVVDVAESPDRLPYVPSYQLSFFRRIGTAINGSDKMRVYYRKLEVGNPRGATLRVRIEARDYDLIFHPWDMDQSQGMLEFEVESTGPMPFDFSGVTLWLQEPTGIRISNVLGYDK